jgi:hypothetical protein
MAEGRGNFLRAISLVAGSSVGPGSLGQPLFLDFDLGRSHRTHAPATLSTYYLSLESPGTRTWGPEQGNRLEVGTWAVCVSPLVGLCLTLR